MASVTNIEVWVTNDQNNDLTNATMVAAIDYLGEPDLNNFSDPQTRFSPNLAAIDTDKDNKALPANSNTDLFRELINDEAARGIDEVATRLKTVYGMKQNRDFEVQNMRKLNANEYTYHPELGYVSLSQRLRPNQVLGVSYEYTYTLNNGKLYKIGEMTNESNSGGVDQRNRAQTGKCHFCKNAKKYNSGTRYSIMGFNDEKCVPFETLLNLHKKIFSWIFFMKIQLTLL